MNVYYFMLDYTELSPECTLVIKEHELDVGSWLATVKQLLGSRKATLKLLDFLVTTRTRERSQALKQEQGEITGRSDEVWRPDKERMEDKEEWDEDGEMRDEEEDEEGQNTRGG